MRIAHIVPGAGGMYCGMCIRESALVSAQRALGADVTLLSTYTPIRTDDADPSDESLHFGGINVYLQQKSFVFRHTPWLIDRLFNLKSLVRWTTKTSTKVDPDLVGSLATSMLAGEDGHQRKELAKLVHALKHSIRPDLVVLSTALLTGMVRGIKSELGIPVLVGLQGEDLFLDQLPTAHRERCLALLRDRIGEADGYIAISAYYADEATARFGVDRKRTHAIPCGVNLDGCSSASAPTDAFTVGHLARISPEKGLRLLVDAFAQLRSQAPDRPCRLRVAGWLGKPERSYMETVRRMVKQRGIEADFEYLGELDRPEKLRFLQGLSAFSVPTEYRDPRGLGVLEAMANGVPVVQPRHGVFPEFIDATGGGLLVTPNDPADLARGLHRLMHDPDLRDELARKARAGICAQFSVEAMARSTLDVYHQFARPTQAG